VFSPEQFVADAKKSEQRASVTMVTFNRWKCTGQSLISVFANTFLPHVLTVVDNGSWDETVANLKKLRRADLIDRLILLPENRGIAVGKNFGLKVSEGEAAWYCCIDNDIEVSPYWLSYLCYASELPGLGIVGNNVQGFGQPWGHTWFTPTLWKEVEGVFLDNCPNPGGLYVMSAATLVRLGYFCEHSIYGLEDSELHTRQQHHGLRSAYVRNANCRELPDENFEMQDGAMYRDFKTSAHNAAVLRVRELTEQGKLGNPGHYETKVTVRDIGQYTWCPDSGKMPGGV